MTNNRYFCTQKLKRDSKSENGVEHTQIVMEWSLCAVTDAKAVYATTQLLCEPPSASTGIESIKPAGAGSDSGTSKSMETCVVTRKWSIDVCQIEMVH